MLVELRQSPVLAFMQIEIHTRTDDPCDQVKEVGSYARVHSRLSQVENTVVDNIICALAIVWLV